MSSSINKVATGNAEWYTPTRYVDAARVVMGSIDIDPASSDIAQQEINAGIHHTKETNGLDKPWFGNVWLNPPYHSTSKKAGPGIDAFADKLIAEMEGGNASQAIFLAQAKTDTRWFQDSSRLADVVMFTHGRIKFLGADGKEGKSPSHGSVFFYFGKNADEFIWAFGQFGHCYKRMN